MHGGILKFRGDFREIQVVFPNHLLAFLKLNPADIFAGGNLQILVEQSRQIAGAHVHLPGNQRYGQLLSDVGGDELLSLADDLVFRVHRVGGLQLAAGGGGGFPQEQKQQQIQLAQDNVPGQGIRGLLLPEHILEQSHRLLGGGEFPVQQGVQPVSPGGKGNGYIPGGNANVGVLHMPLTGAVDHQVALLQKQILAFGYGVQRPLIHIGQLRHGVGLPGKQEALLLLLVEEGVHVIHLELAIDLRLGKIPGAHFLRRRRSPEQGVRLTDKGGDDEKHPRLDAHGLIQIVVLVVFPVQAYGKHAGAGTAGCPGVGKSAENHRVLLGKGKGRDCVFIKTAGAVGAFRGNGAKALEGNLIQIPDHGHFPLKKITGSCLTLLLYIR